jgi:hypothetical protein
MAEQQLTTGEADVRLVIDFESMNIDDLADLLAGFRSALVRSLIVYLRDSSTDENKRALERLGASYRKFLENRERDEFFFPGRRYPDFWHHNFRIANQEEPPLFEEWTKYLTRRFAIEVGDIRIGSYDIGVYVAGLLFLLQEPSLPFNYSLTKDIVNQFRSFIRNGIAFPRPQGTLESLSDIFDKACENPRITKLEIQANGEKVNLKAEFEKRRKR